MDASSIAIPAGLFLLGVVVGRRTAPTERTVTVEVPRAAPPPANLTADQAVEAALRRRNKIVAIKLYRDAYGSGLKEAKDVARRSRRGSAAS